VRGEGEGVETVFFETSMDGDYVVSILLVGSFNPVEKC